MVRFLGKVLVREVVAVRRRQRVRRKKSELSTASRLSANVRPLKARKLLFQKLFIRANSPLALDSKNRDTVRRINGENAREIGNLLRSTDQVDPDRLTDLYKVYRVFCWSNLKF